jgi:hypothetical protein
MICDVRDGTHTSTRDGNIQEALHARQGGKLHLHSVFSSHNFCYMNDQLYESASHRFVSALQGRNQAWRFSLQVIS